MAAAIVVIAVGLALLTPVGWAYSEPQYSAQVGVPLRFGPRKDDIELSEAFSHRHPGASALRFRARDLVSVPPGLAVESATGTLIGTPSMAGTYTLALSVDDGRDIVSGRSFRLKVLPSVH